jgi:hypothetical protein
MAAAKSSRFSIIVHAKLYNDQILSHQASRCGVTARCVRGNSLAVSSVLGGIIRTVTKAERGESPGGFEGAASAAEGA